MANAKYRNDRRALSWLEEFLGTKNENENHLERKVGPPSETEPRNREQGQYFEFWPCPIEYLS